MPNSLDLQGVKISETYQRLVQTLDGSYYDGHGNLLSINLSTSDVTGELPFTNIQKISSFKLLGNSNNSSSNLSEITLGAGLFFTGNTLNVSSTAASLTGTTNRIDIVPDTSSTAIDISIAYIGQTSITTLGTISSGVWNGSAISVLYGGTGLTTVTAGDLIYSSSTNTLNKLSIGENNSILKVISGLPSWEILPYIPIQAFNETPDGILDGVNTVFTTANNFIINSTQLFLNGQRLKLGLSFDYIESAPGQITFNIPPIDTDNLIIDYIF
ncbi:MAG: hypothetical protein ABIP51_01600 [Bacteroidia bacterium]